MATAPVSNIDVNVVPLADVKLARLEDLFDRQCDEWFSLLRWDYTGPSRLIRNVAREGELTGFAASVNGDVIGFAFYVIEGSRCSVGDIYVAEAWRGRGVDRRLTLSILEHIEKVPRVRRVESQCLSIGNDGIDELFVSRGFERFNRQYLMINLDSPSQSSRRPQPVSGKARSLPDVVIRPWSDSDFSRAAQVIHASYVGQHDSKINAQYRTEPGCVELMSILTDTLWCGKFLPEKSKTVIDRSSGNLIGVLIASKIANRAGHIGQISIAPAFQGCGLGRRLIEATLANFRESGFETTSLAVTKENFRALHLYQSCGFRLVHSFPVFFHGW